MSRFPRLRRAGRRLLALAAGAACLASLAACGPRAPASGDVLSQKVPNPQRTQLTVLVKNAFSIHNFEWAVEEAFPNLDLVQVGNYTRDRGVEEYARRLEHDDLPDLVMTWPLDVGEEYWDDRLLDLSGLPFTSRYSLSMLRDISRDGKLYYLPGPAQIRGIVYNKTLFQEHNWAVPTDFEGFITLCKTIEASGIRALQLGFENAEVLDTAFVGYSYADAFRRPQDAQWISDYNAGAGNFIDHFGPALDTFQRMIDEGIWRPSDLEVNYADREKLLFTRQCAMVEDSTLLARIGDQRTGSTDEFALMPFFNSGAEGDWARLYMVCYIGMNRHLAEPQNREKYDLALQLMDYISTPEGQERLASDTGGMFSSLIGAQPPDVPEITDLAPALLGGRYAVFPALRNAQSALRAGLTGMLQGSLIPAQVGRMVDQENRTPRVPTPPAVLGQASADFSLTDTGSYVTDVMRRASGCDIALFLDGGKDGLYNNLGISGRIYAGDITQADLDCVMPDLHDVTRDTLWKVTLTVPELLEVLEYAIPVNNNQTGWFYYFSGLRMEFDPTALPGERVKKITLEDGSALEEDASYTVAILERTVPEALLTRCEQTGLSIAALLAQSMAESGTISPSGDGRLTLVP